MFLKIKFRFSFWPLLIFAIFCLTNSKVKEMMFICLHGVLVKKKKPEKSVYVCVYIFLLNNFKIHSCILFALFFLYIFNSSFHYLISGNEINPFIYLE